MKGENTLFHCFTCTCFDNSVMSPSALKMESGMRKGAGGPSHPCVRSALLAGRLKHIKKHIFQQKQLQS